MAEEVTRRSHATLTVVFHGGTLLNKELEIMDAVKSGNVAIGSPSGAASTVFPELGVFLVPYLVRDYAHAYKMFNGEIGKSLDEQFQRKYRLKILLFFDYGFRHFWNNKRPIAKPDDLKGLKLRVQQGKVFADTVNGLGANAVPMSWSEVVPAAQQGVIDGADLPILDDLPQLRAVAGRDEPRQLEEPDVRGAEAVDGGLTRGAGEGARGDRERRQPPAGQGDPRGEGDEGQRE